MLFVHSYLIQASKSVVVGNEGGESSKKSGKADAIIVENVRMFLLETLFV